MVETAVRLRVLTGIPEVRGRSSRRRVFSRIPNRKPLVLEGSGSERAAAWAFDLALRHTPGTLPGTTRQSVPAWYRGEGRTARISLKEQGLCLT